MPTHYRLNFLRHAMHTCSELNKEPWKQLGTKTTFKNFSLCYLLLIWHFFPRSMICVKITKTIYEDRITTNYPHQNVYSLLCICISMVSLFIVRIMFYCMKRYIWGKSTFLCLFRMWNICVRSYRLNYCRE